MFTPDTLSLAADAIAVQTVKLHSGDPGAAGANNEIADTETAITFGAAVDGVRAQTGTLEINVPAGTVSHYSLWDGATLRKIDALPEAETYASPGVARIGSATITVSGI